MKPKTPPRIAEPTGRLGIVQCCHLPHFFFAADRLRKQSPQRPLDALLLDHPQVREYLPLFPPFDQVHFWSRQKAAWTPSHPSGSDEEPLDLVFPLLTRGYRRIKRVAAALPHARLWEIGYDGMLVPLSRSRLHRSAWLALHSATEEFAEYLRTFSHRPLGDRVLVIHSAHPSLLESSRETWEKLLPEKAQVEHLQESRLLQDWKRLSRRRPDAAVVFFSGERGYLKLKLLPLLLRLRRVLVINENGHAFYLDPRSFARFLYHRVRHGVSYPQRQTGVLFIQTENQRHSDHALRQLRDEALLGSSEVTVLCHEREKDHFESLPQVDRVISYGDRFNEFWKVYRQIRQLSPEVVTAIFSGRPVFRKQKLLFLLLADRRQLAFNAHLDCYWLTPRAIPRLFRSEPLLYPEPVVIKGVPVSVTRPQPEVLLIQTEDDAMTAEAAQLLASRKVSGGKPVSVLCAHDKARQFAALPNVLQVHTYRPSAWMANLKLFARLWRSDRDIVAAIYSGRPIFRLQKLLLLVLRSRNRIVFNEHLDCFHLRRSRLWSLMRLPDLASPTRRRAIWLETWLVTLAKAALYVPRFLFLAGWLTWEKLKRARYREKRHGV